MAHFQRGSDRISRQTITVPLGAAIKVSIWGYWNTFVTPPQPLQAFTPKQNVAGVETASARIAANNLLPVTIIGKSVGEAPIFVAPNAGDDPWDSFTVKVVPDRYSELRRAVTTKRLTFNKDQEASFVAMLNGTVINGKQVKLSNGLKLVLESLVAAGPVRVMRTIAADNGAHGRVIGGEYHCEAVDVAAFQGTDINFQLSAEKMIEVVCNLIRALPPTTPLSIGLPRPVGGKGKFNADLDVFYPVRNVEEANAAFDGHLNFINTPQGRAATNGVMLEPAGKAVRAALPVKGWATYPDGADHVHVQLARDLCLGTPAKVEQCLADRLPM